MNILFLMGGNSDKNKEDYPLYLTEVKGKNKLNLPKHYIQNLLFSV